MKKSLFVAGGVMIAALSTLAQTATQTQQPSSERTQQALKKLEDDPAYKSLLSLRQRRALSLLGGVMAFSHSHLCPRCFSLLADSGSAPDDQAAA